MPVCTFGLCAIVFIGSLTLHGLRKMESYCIDNKDSEYLKDLNNLGFKVFVDRLVMKSKKSKVDLAKSIVEYLSR